MSQIFGNFINEFPLEHDSLELRFTSYRSIKQQWRNNRLSAHFIADYFSSFLLIEENNSETEKRIEESKSAVSYIGNELLENAVKFDKQGKHRKVKFGIHFLEDLEEITAVVFTENSVTTQKAEKFQAFIEELLSADPNDLYVRQIEKIAEDEQSEASGLGLLTLINDYSAKLGWKFESDPGSPQIVTVTTMAQVVV